jgi:hypothetical protein
MGEGRVYSSPGGFTNYPTRFSSEREERANGRASERAANRNLPMVSQGGRRRRRTRGGGRAAAGAAEERAYVGGTLCCALRPSWACTAGVPSIFVCILINCAKLIIVNQLFDTLSSSPAPCPCTANGSALITAPPASVLLFRPGARPSLIHSLLSSLTRTCPGRALLGAPHRRFADTTPTRQPGGHGCGCGWIDRSQTLFGSGRLSPTFPSMKWSIELLSTQDRDLATDQAYDLHARADRLRYEAPGQG